MSSDRSTRPTPLPPNVSPKQVVNLAPEPDPPLTPQAAAYLASLKRPEDDSVTARPTPEVKGRTMPNEYRELEKRSREKQSRPQQQQQKRLQQLDEQLRDHQGVTNFGSGLRDALNSDTMKSADRNLRQAFPPFTTVSDGMKWLSGPLVEPLVNRTVLSDTFTRQLKDEKARLQTAPPAPRPGERYNILVLTGGVAHGAYQVGVLCGWSDAGTLPEFDVITGVSTGALIAAATFPGKEFLGDARRLYTSVHRQDVYKFKKFPPFGLGTASVATNDPLRKLVHQVTDQPGYFEKVAAEHAKGRRFYVGTTNLDTMRFVTWDMGAIASEGTPESRKLYVDLVLAASALPALFNPSEITLTIDGCKYTEFHVDGGTTRNLFIYPPSDWPGEKADPEGRLLAGGNVYVVFGGKVYGDPTGTKPKLAPVGARALATLLSSCQRAELFRCFTKTELVGMNFHLAAIPPEYLPLFPSNEFDPDKMTALFCEGYSRVQSGRAWNQELLEEAVTEVIPRRGTCLTVDRNADDTRSDFGLPGAPGPLPVNRGPVLPRMAPVMPLRTFLR